MLRTPLNSSGHSFPSKSKEKYSKNNNSKYKQISNFFCNSALIFCTLRELALTYIDTLFYQPKNLTQAVTSMQNRLKSHYPAFEGTTGGCIASTDHWSRWVLACSITWKPTNILFLYQHQIQIYYRLCLEWLLFYLKISHWTKWGFFYFNIMQKNNLVCYISELKTSNHLNQVLDAKTATSKMPRPLSHRIKTHTF